MIYGHVGISRVLSVSDGCVLFGTRSSIGRGCIVVIVVVYRSPFVWVGRTPSSVYTGSFYTYCHIPSGMVDHSTLFVRAPHSKASGRLQRPGPPLHAYCLCSLANHSAIFTGTRYAILS
jgi:hypothetical protein